MTNEEKAEIIDNATTINRLLDTETEKLREKIIAEIKASTAITESEHLIYRRKIKDVQIALALTNSMIICGEGHSETSRKIISEALKEV